jgi:16S rRNA (cytidine1402-2'-O)-methyltransferase
VKKGRQTRLFELKTETRTMIFYESPHRIVRTLQDVIEAFGGDRPASGSRELTKVFEENAQGNLTELLAHFSAKELAGEFVVVVRGAEKA